VTYSMGLSLDGYVVGPDGAFDWTAPADRDPSLDDSMLEWAALWQALPKVVFSTTLSAVQGNAHLASGGLAAEIDRLRAEPGDGDIAIGGATLAAEAASLGLIDEYRARVYPVLR
jgi:dihydrofolate reductase